ncbi:hypothetical protein D3C76_1386680 [compost metagenome]
MRYQVDRRKQRFADGAQQLQPKREQHGNEQYLQDFSISESTEYRGRHDVRQEADHALVVRRLGITGNGSGIQRRRIDVHANAWLEQVYPYQTDDQRQGGQDLEIHQRLETDTADFLQVLHAGDATDNRAEDDRRNQHLDQLDECVA